jgi:uncharacterized membrane protein YkvA (DUF1232 family)
MALREQLKSIALKLKVEFAFYQRLQKHPQTPILAKALLWLALAYLVLPFDLIPDFLPIIGQLDDVVIIPLLLFGAVRLTPAHVVDACRQTD